jgi:hypothetical protein
MDLLTALTGNGSYSVDIWKEDYKTRSAEVEVDDAL